MNLARCPINLALAYNYRFKFKKMLNSLFFINVNV